MNKNIIKGILPYLIIIIVVILFRTFIATPVRVDGVSMDPTLKNGQILILNKLDKNYKRFDIVVLKVNGTKLIKRIIGLPGEHIAYKDNKLYVNGKYVAEDFLNESAYTLDFDMTVSFSEPFIKEGYYLVLGDNRDESADGRIFGSISKDTIIGKPIFSIFPFNRIGKISSK